MKSSGWVRGPPRPGTCSAANCSSVPYSQRSIPLPPRCGHSPRMRRKRTPPPEQPASHAAERRAPIPAPGAPAELTPRQRDVATLLVRTGLSYKQIAAQLHLGEGTMRTHAEHVYRALGVHSRAELTVALRAWV